MIAPDLAGYGSNAVSLDLPTTLAQEVESLRERCATARGPIHLVGHSYGGAIAFKIATASAYASRIRSLTLIEPILPTLLMESTRTGGCMTVSWRSRMSSTRISANGIGAGGDRQVHRVLARLRPARAARRRPRASA